MDNKYTKMSDRYLKMRNMCESVNLDHVGDYHLDNLFEYMRSRSILDQLQSKYNYDEIYDELIEGWNQNPLDD